MEAGKKFQRNVKKQIYKLARNEVIEKDTELENNLNDK